MQTKTWVAATVFILLLSSGGTAAGQEVAGSFDQLRVLVKPGDTITVSDDGGREMTGTIANLSSSSVALLVGDQRRDLQANQIAIIRQRRSDPLANGAKWGFGVGATIGLLTGIGLASGYDAGNDSALIVFGTLIYGGLGAGIGTGVDAMISGNQVIYARRAATVSVRF